MQTKILFCVVSYFNEEEVIRFVSEELMPHSFPFEAVVIDNADRPSFSWEALKEKDERIHVYVSGRNLGYFGAAGYGLQQYRSAHGALPDLVVLCNTDLKLVGEHFMEDLSEKYARNGFHLLGPDIYSTFTRRHQNPYLPERITLSKLKKLEFLSSNVVLYNLFLLYYLPKAMLAGFRTKWGREGAGSAKEVYSLHGSFIVFSKEFFEHGGTLDFPVFLFGEEIILGEIARGNRMKVLYEPDIQVIHHEHATTGIFRSRRLVKYLNQSYRIILEKYYS